MATGWGTFRVFLLDWTIYRARHRCGLVGADIPVADAGFGHDISDYSDVDPVFGTLDDFDRLVRALHARNIRLILDVVPNHTSDRHPWFVESRSSHTNPKREWYVWAGPGPDGGPPNNWLSRFGGSAWEWDAGAGQYYYHAFLPQQPDLNWHNPEVRQVFAEVLRFWLKRDVDGFRVDASAVLAEDPLLRDDPPNPDFDESTTPPPERLKRVFTDGRPETMDYLEDMRAVVDEFPDRVLLGEVQGGVERIYHRSPLFMYQRNQGHVIDEIDVHEERRFLICVAATPPNPKTAAMIEMIRNTSAQWRMKTSS